MYITCILCHLYYHFSNPYLVFVYQVVHHVFISPNRNIIIQLGLGSVQPVIQGLQGVSEPSREQQSFLQLMLPEM